MTNTCRRKNGLGPRSVKIVITDTQAMSAAVDRYPMRSWRANSPRPTPHRTILNTRYEPRTTKPISGRNEGCFGSTTTTARVPEARSTLQNAMIFSVRENASRGTGRRSVGGRGNASACIELTDQWDEGQFSNSHATCRGTGRTDVVRNVWQPRTMRRNGTPISPDGRGVCAAPSPRVDALAT